MTLPRPGVQAALVGAVAAIVVALTIQAGGPAMNDPDSAASVLYFRHIVGGQQLETFVSTTPKPLLTLLYGAAWTVTGDWRTLGWLTLVAFGVAVACGMDLVRRLAGGAAAAFLVVAMTLSAVLALEVSRANSLVWAVAAMLAAGWALTLPRPRVTLAGVALLVALLCRTETIVLLVPATAWLVWLAARGRPAEARGLAPLLVAWLAIPVACLHDLVLTGNPLYWLSVPAGYTAVVAPDLRPLRPIALLGEVVARYAGMPLLVALGVIGGVRLARQRQWPALGAFVCLTVGVIALLVFIAWRGVYVTTRYLEQADVALLVAAAVGAGWLAEWARRAIPPRLGLTVAIAPRLGVELAIAAAVAVSLPPAQFDGRLAAELDRVRTTSRNADLVRPHLAEILAAESGRRPPPPVDGPAGLRIIDTTQARLVVPRPLINRLLVDLDAPLTVLADSWLAIRRDGALGSPRPGQAIYHDRAADLRPELFAVLETDRPIDGPFIRLSPRFVDRGAGIWILEASVR